MWGDEPNSKGELIFSTSCLPETFAKAVLSAAEKIFNEYGENGYKEKWAEHDFPLLQLQELKRLIGGLNA
jgi:hypothetical protein